MRKIAIVGTAPSTVGEAPYGDRSWEIWSMGRNGHQKVDAWVSQHWDKEKQNREITFPPNIDAAFNGGLTRFDRWFEVHSQKQLTACGSWPVMAPFMGRLEERLTIAEPNPLFPKATLLPIDALVKMFPRKYFQSSIDWMVANAIYELSQKGIESGDEIGVWGVDMLTDGEYAFQLPSISYYLGIAEGKGIKVTLPDMSRLLRGDRMYGVEYGALGVMILKAEQEIAAQVNRTELELISARDNAAFARGQQDMLNTISRRFG